MVRRTLGTIVVFLALAPAALGAPLSGGAGPDSLSGSPRADRIVAGGGSDILRGGRGADRLIAGPGRDRAFGGAGADRVFGGPGNDILRGGRGADRLVGGRGADRIVGGPGRDRIVGGPGRDVVSGGPGADTIVVRDGRPDRVRCGSGGDLVIADTRDRIATDCERVRRPAGGEATGPGASKPWTDADEEAILNPRDPEYAEGRAAKATRLAEAVLTHDGFEVRVIAPAADATDEVLAAHPFNEPPALGKVYVSIRMTVRYLGEGEASFDAASRLGAWDPVTGGVWRADEDECGYMADALPDGFLEAGQEVSGSVCWSLPVESAGRVLAVDDDLTGTPSTVLAIR